MTAAAAAARRNLAPLLLLGLLALLVLWPQLAVLLRSLGLAGGAEFSLSAYARSFDPERPAALRALWNSVWTSLASVALAAAAGVPLAFLVDRARFPLRAALAASLVLPLLLPPIVGVLVFKQFLFGEYGLVPEVLARAFGWRAHLDGFAGVLALHAYAFFPFFYLFTSAALQRLDAQLPEAAEGLGAGRGTRLRRVVLPLLRPALAGAAVLVLLNALGSFSAPLFFAPDADLLTLRIYNLREEDPAGVSATASLLALAALLLLLPLRAFEKRADVAATGKGLGPPAAAARAAPVRFLLGALVLVVCFALLLPHLAVIVLSFAADTGARDSVVPHAFTLAHYARVFGEGAFRGPMTHSLVMAGAAALGTLVLGLWIAIQLGRRRSPLNGPIEVLAYLPLALPATVLAFNLLETFSEPRLVAGNRVLAGTALLLPLAYLVRHLPISARATQSALAALDPALVDAAHSLGASRTHVLRRIVLPLLLPGLASGVLLALLSGLTEFPASILLYVPENEPIAVEIFQRQYNRSLGEPAALSTLLLVVQTVILLAANRLVGLGRRR